MTIEPYLCKISNQTFTTPCSVSSCPAHVGNLNRCGVKVVPITNCAHVDFNLQGFPESLNYAVEEQGFVGYRDLKYMESFFNVNEADLRDIYTSNVNQFRKLVALTWAVNQLITQPLEPIFHCKRCGHPTAENVYQCTSASLCEEREELVRQDLGDIVKYVHEKTLISFFYVMWKSLAIRFIPPIDIAIENKLQMEEVKGPNL